MNKKELKQYQLNVIEILKKDYLDERIITIQLKEKNTEIRKGKDLIKIKMSVLFEKGYTVEAAAQKIYETLKNKL